MGRESKLPNIIRAAVFILICLWPVQGYSDSNENGQTTGRIRYSLIMVKEKEISRLTEPVIPRETAKNEIFLYYKPISDVYVYVYLVNPGKEFKLIKPAAFEELDRIDYDYKAELIPLTEKKLLVAGSGCRELHLLLSNERLPAVESLMNELNKLKPDQQERFTELSNKLEAELRKIVRTSHFPPEPIPSHMPVNNTFRTDEELLDWLDKHIEVSPVKGFYEIIYSYECEAKK